MKENIEDDDLLYNDKYEASESVKKYLIWLVQTGKAEILKGIVYKSSPPVKQKNGQIKRINYNESLTPEECFNFLINDGYDYSFEVNFQKKIYEVSSEEKGSGWLEGIYENYGGMEKLFEKYVNDLKESGEYYIPGTEIPRFKASRTGKKFIKIGENKYLLADRDKIYEKISGSLIFNDKFLITDNKSVIDETGKKENLQNMMYIKRPKQRYNFNVQEIFMGYNNDQVIFMYETIDYNGERYGYNECHGHWNNFQKIERECKDNSVSMFCTGNTIGFVDGNKVRLCNEKGEVSTFKLEENPKNIEIKNGYVLINNNIICCGAESEDKNARATDYKKINPVFKKISNPNAIENYMKDFNEHEYANYEFNSKVIQNSDFIENENGFFFTNGLTEEEKLKLYKENGFNELYNKLESIKIAREEKIKQEEEKDEEAREKTNEYLKGKVLSLCHLRKRTSDRGKIIEADNVEFVENDNAVVLYEKQEKGWGYGPVYDAGIIYVPEAKKRAKNGKLHLDVPEDSMGIIIGKKGVNINNITSILKEKGIELSKIILHPKSREEIKITLENIENTVKNSKDKNHESKQNDERDK